MNKQSATYIILVFLIAIIAINYWPAYNSKTEINNAPSNADYFIEKVSIKQFDDNGYLENQLNADKLEHFKNKQTSEIFAPQIIITSANETTWKIAADVGKLIHSNKLVELNGSVLIEQSMEISAQREPLNVSASSPPSGSLTPSATSIKTENLNFSLMDNTAVTIESVLITTKNSNTRAKEMIADFDKNIIVLKGHTKTKGVFNDLQKPF